MRSALLHCYLSLSPTRRALSGIRDFGLSENENPPCAAIWAVLMPGIHPGSSEFTLFDFVGVGGMAEPFKKPRFLFLDLHLSSASACVGHANRSVSFQLEPLSLLKI